MTIANSGEDNRAPNRIEITHYYKGKLLATSRSSKSSQGLSCVYIINNEKANASHLAASANRFQDTCFSLLYSGAN